MGRFTVIPQNTFNALQTDAGVILKTFNPANPVAPRDEDIVCATTGGITASCVPTYSDMGSDVDNCPNGVKELKKLESWECKLAFTSLGTSPELIRMTLGAADIDAESGAIVPRKNLSQSDFTDLWWVGDRADGGLVAVNLKNALSTAGFTLKTTKNGKGQVTVELTGHVSLQNQAEIPMKFYSEDPGDAIYRVSQTLSHVTSDYTDTVIEGGETLEVTLEAESGYEIASVAVLKNGAIITESAWNATTGKVTVTSVDGDITIIASAKVE